MPAGNRWCVAESDLLNINPVKARDLIITCFLEAQRETIARAKQLLHAPASSEDIRLSITTIVKDAFLKINGDFEKPTKDNLVKVTEFLAQKAELWHTPPDIIDFHKKQIQKILFFLQS